MEVGGTADIYINYLWFMRFSFDLTGSRILLSEDYNEMKNLSLIPLFLGVIRMTTSLTLQGNLAINRLSLVIFSQSLIHLDVYLWMDIIDLKNNL